MASTPACLLLLWPLVLILCDPAESIKFPEGYLQASVQQPPEFTTQPDKEIVLYPTDEIILKWEAIGNPPVTYRWTKDGEQFDPEQVQGIKQLENSGTLIIHANNGNVPTRFNGLYRCYASNILGTAVSSESRIIVENAPQWPKEEVAPITAEEGTHTVLPCNPPTSADPPKIYWLNSKIEHIAQDERVTVGQDGNLYFANVQMKDSQPDYICNAHFQGPRLIIQKEPIELKVIPTNTFSYQKPILIVPESTHKSYVALLGKPLILECIAAGLPTPSVEWIHLNRLNPSPGVTFENYNKTLCIPSVTEDDDGDYQCIARNEHGSIRHTYTVNVEAAPYWIKMPVSQIYGPGENVRLDCEVDGKPKPRVSWSINGTPLKDVMPDPRRKIQSGALIFSEVQPNDTAVIQCQAHNKHGSLLANAYILVVWLPAEILTPDGIEYAVVENQIVILHCKTFGAPRPKVQWFMEDMNPALKDERTFIFTNGSLKLQEVRREDAGNFTCLAENDQNNVSIIARLVVKGATQIEEGPINMEKKQGESVMFYCKVLFDESIPKRGIQWRLNGKDIEESDDNNKYIIGDMSLTVTNVDYSDQGTYSCLAWTTLDSVEKNANLLVYGEPGPVSNLEVQRQQNHQVKLTWTPGDNHNREINEYIVFCEETKFGPAEMELLTTVPGNQPWTILHLSPFRSYNFYVQASNDQGKSELSSRSASHATEPAAPERNPSDVRGEGNETTNMIITWTPLPHKEWNAPKLRYRVQWRLENEDQWEEVEVDDSPVLVTDTPVFSPYEIKVQAQNDFGKGPEPQSEKGYSGEDVPEAVPEDLLIEMINSTTIKLSWILPNREKIWGHLKGFRVYYFRLGTLAERSRRQAHLHFHSHGELLILGNVSEVILGGLRPWSRYQVQLAVLNGRGEGPRSEAMEFVTPEGVPSIPESFQLDYLSDTAVLLEWMAPKFPNGRLLRYVLGYQQGESTANQTEMDIGNIHIPATQLSLNLSDLDPHTPYKFSLWAETKEGRGEVSLLEEYTMHESVNLSFVNISLGETGENFTTIIWIPRQNQRDVEFAVHLMSKTDKGQWHDVGKARSGQGSYSIPDLQPGKQYRVRLVKVHRTGDVQIIWESDVETSGVVQERQKNFAAEGWFIGFISAIVLLILVLVLLCFIKRSKGGKYSVKDKEDTQVDSEARPMKDETFGEYRSLESDNEEKPFTSSQPSLNGDIKALGSDDSLADYGGSVDVQFNEDGSFIGQYSGQKGKDGGGNDSSGATSPTNVVTALE
ncbi:neural cell adhesion molecule L1 [Protobothrops mucrosquamatus]|uniref:neural cell adhesion molecule L1 n=1 Tax=Protobothrops mucrosquamatus TaxID=103944 RepID=UPI0010FB4D9F|nr:neural cell adhesion molecule L1 [Protobothrops mucrosquamatus]